ncbi:MAG: hypothetical protein L0J76_06405 [Tetragenococcus halophilus]|nr:hypothetical protein [Tetragenococcus halophilus]
MDQKEKKINSKKAIFPGLMTLLAFLSFVYVYWLLTYRAIHPFYFRGLLFAIPFIVLGVISYLTAQGKIQWIASIIITLLFSVTFLVASLNGLFYLSFEATKVNKIDIENYERILRLSDDSLTKHYPKEIPDHAKNVRISHQSPFVQAGEIFQLRFQTDAERIKDYQEEFAKKAIKVGTIEEIEEGAIFKHSDLPFKSIIYLLVSEPYQANNWNHGEYSLVAINEETNEIVFLMEDW